MQHRMAIGTHWNQILDWIYFILLSNVGERAKVMDVNEATAKLAKCELKSKEQIAHL